LAHPIASPISMKAIGWPGKAGRRDGPPTAGRPARPLTGSRGSVITVLADRRTTQGGPPHQ
jgi:hypothetical protein